MKDKKLKTEFRAKTARQSDAPDMEKINAQALRELSEEEVFTFKIAACDTLVDRDNEHFTRETLEEMAQKYIGKTVIMDHSWTAKNQTARIYDAYTAPMETGEATQLVLLAYMLRTEGSQEAIDAIEGGILREVSVGCFIKNYICDICGKDYRTECAHYAGREYDGQVCTVSLSGCADVYEVSFVAVPAQPKAGVIKEFDPEQDDAEKSAEEQKSAEAAQLTALDLALEEERYRY